MNRHPQRHLTEEEFVAFVLEDLSDELEQGVDQHLERCVACAQELEGFYEAQEKFPVQEWARRRGDFVAKLRERIFQAPSVWQRLAASLRIQAPSIYVGIAGARAGILKIPPLDEETEDGMLRWRILDEGGDLTIRFGSHEVELEGTQLRLESEGVKREVVLSRVAPDQVGGEVIFSMDERVQILPADTDLHLEVVGDEEEEIDSL